MMAHITITEHKQFDFQTQLRLDQLWSHWATFDQTGNYQDEVWMARSDKLWLAYKTALSAAYDAVATAEVDSLVGIIRSGLRRQFKGQQAYKCLAAELNGKAQQ